METCIQSNVYDAGCLFLSFDLIRQNLEPIKVGMWKVHPIVRLPSTTPLGYTYLFFLSRMHVFRKKVGIFYLSLFIAKFPMHFNHTILEKSCHP
jgi:hypothetical protein